MVSGGGVFEEMGGSDGRLVGEGSVLVAVEKLSVVKRSVTDCSTEEIPTFNGGITSGKSVCGIYSQLRIQKISSEYSEYSDLESSCSSEFATRRNPSGREIGPRLNSVLGGIMTGPDNGSSAEKLVTGQENPFDSQ